MMRLAKNVGPSGSGTQLDWDRLIMEVLIRAFNAHLARKATYAMPRRPYTLSAIS